MPGKVKVKILSGRNLPVMDRSSDTTDAYVEVKLGTTTFKTDVCRKSLNPQWNSEWYRFELDDAELQDEPLQIRIMDHDTYSANDAIGKVYIDLNPLLLPQSAGSGAKNSDSLSSISSSSGGSVMSGWFPVYDTMHGIRGEVNVIVKVDLFTDFNKFRQSSCGVQFFNSGVIPQGYTAQVIHGFVEELVVSDDPEYQWIEKIRTPRASNEARQTTFFKLSGEVQRKIGLKVLELGGNCVIGYHQVFDLEGESGIVVRGIGTAVTLVRTQDCQIPPGSAPPQISLPPYTTPQPPATNVQHDDVLRPDETAVELSHEAPGAATPTKLGISTAITRRSSESDLSITPKGNSLAGSGGSSGGFATRNMYSGTTRSAAMFKENLDMLEYPFLTMSKYPPGFILRVGGTVRANSVKLLERMTNLEEPESRDAWWTELRLEVRSHARALACNVVLGYSEHTAICDDVCVLSASGTAAVINVCLGNSLNATSTDIPEKFTKNGTNSDSPLNNFFEHKADNTKPLICRPRDTLEMPALSCRFCHVPYNESSVPFKVNLIKCAVCKKGKVPDLIFATIDPPDSVPITGSTSFIQAFVSRSKRDCKGELNAKEISDGLPFLEYELHRQLMNKLTVKGMNALFGLKVQKCIGERTLAAYATATAVYLSPLPPPALPKVTAGDAWKDSNTIAEMQKLLQDCVNENKEFFRLRRFSEGDCFRSDSDESEEEILPDIDLNAGGKDTCILEMDDAEDISVVSQLIDPHPPRGFHVSSIETLPGLEQLEVVKNLQMFTQVWRSRVPSTTSVNKHFQRLLQTMYYKLRRMTPCAIAKLSFHIDIPEPEEVQLSVVGMALGLGEVDKSVKSYRRRILSSHSKDMSRDDNTTDLIFRLDEDQNEAPALSRSLEEKATPTASTKPPLSQLKGQVRERTASLSVEERDGKTSLFTSHTLPKEHYGVDITPLSYIAGGRIERYLGNLNFFFIRESNCIRESGGLSGFVHSFVTEVLAILRAHVTALGGNAMVSYTMTHCILLNNQGKNQGQCLINVGGDVVFVSYPSHGSEEKE